MFASVPESMAGTNIFSVEKMKGGGAAGALVQLILPVVQEAYRGSSLSSSAMVRASISSGDPLATIGMSRPRFL